jgi:putative inorganic carbon (hco3(-)) transporter
MNRRLATMADRLHEHGAVVLLAAALPGAIGQSLLWLCPAAALGLAGLGLARGRRLTWRGGRGAGLGLAAIAAMGAVSLYVTPLPDVTLPQALRLWGGLCIAASVRHWLVDARSGLHERRARLLLVALMAAGVGLSLTAPLTVEWIRGKLPLSSDLYARAVIAVEDTVHPNVLAGVIAMILPLQISSVLGWRRHSLYEHSRDKLFVVSMAAAALLNIVVLIVTQSRSGLIACALATVLILSRIWRLRYDRALWIIVAAILGAAAASLLLAASGIATSEPFVRHAGFAIAGRFEIWSIALNMVRDHAWLGIGMGSFGQLADALYPFSTVTSTNAPHAHQLLLQIAVDLGVPGVAAFLIVLFDCFAGGARLSPDLARGDGALVSGAAAALVAGLVHGLTDAVSWGMVRSSPLLWLVIGIAMSAALLQPSRTGQSAD